MERWCRGRGAGASGTEVQVLVLVVQRCRGDMQRCAEMQRCRGAEVLGCIIAEV